MWCVLENKAPTWDNLQKRSFQGLGWCRLCKSDGESVSHLFLQCPFIKEVWKECSRSLGFPCRWESNTVLQAWENRRTLAAQENMKALPLLVIWGVWLARNNLFFVNKACTHEITIALSCGILSTFPQHVRATR